MLRITIQNIHTKTYGADYRYQVIVSMAGGGIKVITEGIIENFIQEDGWRVLVRRILDESKDNK